ncbi:hypothetical protein JCM1840_006426 [Sporobolomyces johnsonii]
MDAFDFGNDSVATATAALLGPEVSGWMLGILLYGAYLALHAQYIASQRYTPLSRPVKGLIWTVFVFVTTYEALVFADLYYWMTTTSRAPTDILLGWHIDLILGLFAGLVACPVQTFLCVRASALIRGQRLRVAFLGFMFLAITLSFVGASLTAATAFMYANNTIDKISPIDYNKSFAVFLWTGARVDILISTSLAISLRQRIHGFNVITDSLLRKLTVVALQTASYTAVLAVAGAVVSTVLTDQDATYSLVHFAFWAPLPSCYALSLYTTLSTRKTIDEHLARPFSDAAYPDLADVDFAEVGLCPFRPLDVPIIRFHFQLGT